MKNQALSYKTGRRRAVFTARICVAAVTIIATQVAFAQTVPDISRWGSNTAIVPIQGYSQGSALTLTWSIVPDGTALSGGGTSNFIAQLDATFGAGPGGSNLTLRPWFTHFQSSYNRWGQLSGLTMQYSSADDGAAQAGSNPGVLGVRGDMRVGGRNIDGPSNVLAFNNFPTNGDMVVDTSDMALFGISNNNFRFLRNVLMHELGHGFGVQHIESNNRNFLMEPFIDTSFDGPQIHDVLIIQRGYGDVYEKGNGGVGNNTAVNAIGLGSVSAGNPISIGDGARSNTVSGTEVDFVSIDDQTDVDFFSFNLTQSGIVELTLEALGSTYNVGPQSGSQISFNIRERSNLALALFDSTGTTLLGFADNTGLGGSEFISASLNAGTYLARITGADNPDTLAIDTQFYGLTISTEAVPEPATMTLLGLAAVAIARRRRKA